MASNVSSSDLRLYAGKETVCSFSLPVSRFPRKDPIQSDLGTSGPVTIGTRPGTGIRVHMAASYGSPTANGGRTF